MPPKTKIFVGKLPPSCKDYELRKLFERYGEVTECSILGNYAFVHMKGEEEAANAIRNLNNWDLKGFKISVEQSTGEKRSGGGMGMRGGGRGGLGFRGRGGGPMRGRGMGMRPSPYDRRPPLDDRYGPPPGPPPAPLRNGYYDDYERRDRRPLPPPVPMDRRPPPPPVGREPYRDPYDRYDSYDRMPHPPPLRRSPPPPLERRPPPLGYDRREDPYDVYARPERDVYGARDMFPPPRRSPPRRSPPRRYPGPPRDLPPRRF
ncbi:UNVERIFIED_CONTAM: hypothetical protein RMT77_006645 [Armadillidium vulgare]